MNDRGHYLRGHPIYQDGDRFRYRDNDELTTTYQSRDCGLCRLPNRADGHDACIGELPGVMNACCGHGSPQEAYIQYVDGSRIAGQEALFEQRRMGQPMSKATTRRTQSILDALGACIKQVSKLEMELERIRMVVEAGEPVEVFKISPEDAPGRCKHGALHCNVCG